MITGTRGAERITHAMVSPHADHDQQLPLSCDVLLVSGGWNPAVHLFSQARGALRYDESLGAFVPGEQLPGVSVAGSANGVFNLAGCLRDGQQAGAAALGQLGLPPAAPLQVVTEEDGESSQPVVLWRVPDVAHEDTQFVDVQRDATVADLARAVRAGMRSIEHIKRYTTIGTAHDQGKTSGVIASGITAELLGSPVENLGTTTFRPPYTPVAFAALAGRSRGRLFDPERVTALHDWHVDPRRGVRGCRAVETPALLPAARRGHGNRGAARVRRRTRQRRHPRRLHAGQDRRARAPTPRSCST